MSSADGPATGLSRRDLLRLGGLLAALLAVALVVVLAGGSSGKSTTAAGQQRGVLTSVSDQRLVLQPEAGGKPQTYAIRPEDRVRLDLFHLQQHAADALPSIVFYDQVGKTRYATRVDDA